MTCRQEFWAEIPVSPDEMTWLPPCVVEARLVKRDGILWLVPAAPPEIAGRSPSGWNAGFPYGWVEVDGPARMLTAGEHARIVAEAVAARNRVTSRAWAGGACGHAEVPGAG